jgi:hypothetical protein
MNQAGAFTEAKQLFLRLFYIGLYISIEILSVHLYECVFYTTGQNCKPVTM